MSHRASFIIRVFFFCLSLSPSPKVRDVAQAYLKSEELHASGLRYAINQDPAAFQVYVSPESNLGWHQGIVPSCTNALPVHLPASTIAGQDAFAFFCRPDDDSVKFSLAVAGHPVSTCFFFCVS